MADSMLNPFRAVRDRYANDPMFRHLVDMMQACIHRAEFTPTEIREAAMLAQIMYEETHIRPITFTRQDVIDRKV